MNFDAIKKRLARMQQDATQGKASPRDVVADLAAAVRRERGCLTEEQVVAFVDAAQHLRGCDHCRSDVKDLTGILAAEDEGVAQRQFARSAPDKDEASQSTTLVPLFPQKRWVPALIAACMVLLCILAGTLTFLTIQNLGRQGRLEAKINRAIDHAVRTAADSVKEEMIRTQVKEEFNRALLNAARFQQVIATAEKNTLVAEARNIHVVPAVAHDGSSYPYPIWGSPGLNPRLGQALADYPDLEAEYIHCLNEWAEVFMRLGDLLAEAGQVDSALRVFEQLREHLRKAKRDDKRLLFAIGELHKMRGPAGHRDALALYEDMIRRGVALGDPRPHNFAGWSAFSLGQYGKALDHYDQALAIFPEYAKAAFNRSLLWPHLPGLAPGEISRRQEQDFEDALRLTLDAHRRESRNPHISFTLAILYAQKQTFEKTLHYIEEAIRLDRTFIVRAETEAAFVPLRDSAAGLHSSHLRNLLEQYKPAAQGGIGAGLPAKFDKSIYTP